MPCGKWRQLEKIRKELWPRLECECLDLATVIHHLALECSAAWDMGGDTISPMLVLLLPSQSPRKGSCDMCFLLHTRVLWANPVVAPGKAR